MRVFLALACSLAGCGASTHTPTPAPDGGSGSGSGVSITDGDASVTISNGGVALAYDKVAGTMTVSCDGAQYISGAYASVDLGGTAGYVTSTTYMHHDFQSTDVTPVHDGFGDGLQIPIENTTPGQPTIRQTFTFYPSHPESFFIDETVESTDGSSLASNYLGALIVDPMSGWVAAPGGLDQRFLDAPFDNDEWVRWDSRAFGHGDFTGIGYEVGALYESTSRAGLVIGSVTHDFWKTGLKYDYDATHHRLRGLNVWGGVATPDSATMPTGPTYGRDGTHDFAAHGKMTGTTLKSPRIYVGCFADWRDGLEDFGKANAITAPPRAWSGGSPIGWKSWGAYGSPVTATQIIGASNHLASSLGGFSAPGGVYVDIDAGFHGDASCSTEACVAARIHANGQKAGTYRTPFSYLGTDLTATVAGTSYTYGQIVLRDDSGAPIRRHNAYMLDVTHPGAKTLIQAAIASVVTDGFDLVKLDFLTDGAMEGAHFDPTVQSGIQAYNQAMAYVDSLLPPTVFISESIAPMFPSQYANSRRISTDVLGSLNDVSCPTWAHYGSMEYMLNSLTFAWWMQGTLYGFNDPDGMALLDYKPSNTATYPAVWAKTRATASAVVGGMFFDSTDYTNATGASRATLNLTNAAVNAVPASGRTFRPVEGDVGYITASTCDGLGDTDGGSSATNVFVRDEGNGAITLAVFNYDATTASTITLDLSRLGLLLGPSYATAYLWAGVPGTDANGSITLTIPAGDSTLVKLTPYPG